MGVGGGPGSEPGEFQEPLQEGPEPFWGPVLGGRGRGEPGHRAVSLTRVQSGGPGSGLSAAAVEAEVGLLRTACSLLRRRMEEVLSAGQWALLRVLGQGGLGTGVDLTYALP